MQTGSPSSAVVLEANDIIPTTVTETDESGRRMETTTLHKVFEIPEDDDNEIGRELIEEYARCLGRHEGTFTDLLRLYAKQKNAETKLTFMLNEAKKKEDSQKKKNEALKQAVDSLAKGLPKIAKPEDGQTRDDKRGKEDDEQTADTDAIKAMIADAERKIEDLRRKKNEVDKKQAELNAKLNEADERVKRKNLDEELGKLANEIDDTKLKIIYLLQAMNQSLRQVEQRLERDYTLKEDPDATKEVRRVLDKLLLDVKYLLDEKRKLDEEAGDLIDQINQLERYLKDAKGLNGKVLEQMRKLTTINKQKAPEPTNYVKMFKFVDDEFDELADALKNQNNQMDKAKDKLEDLDREEEHDKAEFDQAKALKLAKAERLKHHIEELKATNQTLLDELNRSPPKTTPSQELDKEDSNVKKLLEEFEDNDRKQIAALEKKLEQAKRKNDQARKKLKELTSKINKVQEKLQQKQKELKNLRDQAESERGDGDKENREMQRKIDELEKEIEALERQLAELLYRYKQPQDQFDSLGNTEKSLIEKIKILEQQLMKAQADNDQTKEKLKKAEKQLGDMNKQLANEKNRENELNDKLDDLKGKINSIEKGLTRESKRKFEIERDMLLMKPMEFVQTVTTRTVTGPGNPPVTQ